MKVALTFTNRNQYELKVIQFASAIADRVGGLRHKTQHTQVTLAS